MHLTPLSRLPRSLNFSNYDKLYRYCYYVKFFKTLLNSSEFTGGKICASFFLFLLSLQYTVRNGFLRKTEVLEYMKKIIIKNVISLR